MLILNLRFDYASGNNYEVGGKYMDIYSRESNVKTLKAELTSQFNKDHQIKIGTEYRSTLINYTNITVLQSAFTGYQPMVAKPENNEIHQSMISINA